ncbi:hypothetical protein [Lentibacillus sp. CBA3610]|uniref:hypothetical protein n=1 Tax=Lentibacillus sp. CBA3610 TaxID=2518176 RepID=UPI0015956A72|nr:hypothetical protein [Lentibacillus sp. CBA3610]
MDNFSKSRYPCILIKPVQLTKGRPEVTNIQTFNGYKENALLQLVAKAERYPKPPFGPKRL